MRETTRLLRDLVALPSVNPMGRPLHGPPQPPPPPDGIPPPPSPPGGGGARLYGRGSCDVKGGMSAMLAAFARLARERPAGAANVVIACSVDEEHTFLGV